MALPNDADALFLNFQNWQDIESDGADACFDGGILEISTNGGSSWTQVTEPDLLVRAYDGDISTEYDSALAGQQAWCGNVRDFWERYSVDLSTWAGQNVQFRFRFASDRAVGQYGWHVDSVDVKACEPAGPPPVFWDRFEQ